MIFPIPGGKKSGSHYLPRYTRYRVIAGRVIKGGHCICKSCFYHIRVLRRIRRHLPLSTAKTISNSLITSRLDYCNSLINNIAKQDLSKLQRVQNCLARVVLRAPRFSPSLPLLKQLQWLPVNYRIKFKLSTLTYVLVQYINHLILQVSCTFLTSTDNSDHLPHSSFLFPELN